MKFKFWLNVITLLALAVVLIASRADIMEVYHQLANLNIWILLLTIPAQFLCFFAIAMIYKSYLRAARNTNVHLKDLLSVAMEVNFVHHIFPSAGVSAFSYVGLRMKEFQISTAQATMMQLVRTSFAFGTFIPLLLLGVLMLAIEDRASNLIILAASSLATIIALGTIALVYIISNKRRIHTAALAIVQMLNWIIGIFRRNHPETIKTAGVEATLTELHEHYAELRGNFGRMQPVIWWSVASNIFEILMIYVVFVAHGDFVNPGALIIGFAVASMAGLVALLPGGIGVYEPLMVTILISGGVSAPVALSAILVYRVIAFLLSLPTGYFLYHRALRRYGTNNTIS